jgi:NADH:ubiquinone oxidoreductase subunit D
MRKYRILATAIVVSVLILRITVPAQDWVVNTTNNSVTTTGNVGIGTTTPTNALDVATGGVKVRGTYVQESER